MASGAKPSSSSGGILADRIRRLVPIPTNGFGNRDLLRIIVEKAPGSLDELARITGKAKSNLSRTLKTMAGYGLVRLERGERGRITPKVTHDRVELELPLVWSHKAG
jgi:predicted transcriptional regulator